MNQIVITGLDGSGKSTILSALSGIESEKFEIVRLPYFQPDILNGNEQLKKMALFINTLNDEADRDKFHQLKAFALFASMLIFSDIIILKESEGFSTVFCERHPLIDSGIYALFYAEKMKVNTISKQKTDEIELKYKDELAFLLQKLPKEYSLNKIPSIDFFIRFIYKWFHEEKKTSIPDLKILFNVELPSQIYYLKADTEILLSRISGREVSEAHESFDVLAKLGKAYDLLLLDLKISHPQLVTLVNANTFKNLDDFRKYII